MPFRDLDEFLVTAPIELPIRGKSYQFPGAISGRAGLLIRRLAEVADEARQARDEGRVVDETAQVLSEDDEVDLRAELLGDGEREMVDDGLSTAHIAHVFQTLMVWHLAGPEAAEQAWERMAVDPPKPNRQERRSASAGSATSTRQRASTSGTSSPRKRQPSKVSARRGGTSSPAGS